MVFSEYTIFSLRWSQRVCPPRHCVPRWTYTVTTSVKKLYIHLINIGYLQCNSYSVYMKMYNDKIFSLIYHFLLLTTSYIVTCLNVCRFYQAYSGSQKQFRFPVSSTMAAFYGTDDSSSSEESDFDDDWNGNILLSLRKYLSRFYIFRCAQMCARCDVHKNVVSCSKFHKTRYRCKWLC